MRRFALAAASLACVAAIAAPPAEARRLLQDGALEAHVLDGDWCGPRVHVEVRAPTAEVFAGDAYQVRRLTTILRQVMQFECPEARRVSLMGAVNDTAVWRGEADLASGTVTALDTPAPDSLVPLDDRERVRSIQSALNDRGFDAGPADGLMGPRTRSAIRAFQATRGLAETGAADADTYTALHGARSVAADGALFGESGAQEGDAGADAGGDVAGSQAGEALFGGPEPDTAGSPGTTGGAPPGDSGTTATDLPAAGLPTVDGRVALPGSMAPPARFAEVDFSETVLRLALRASPGVARQPALAFDLLGRLDAPARRELVLGALPDLSAKQRAMLEETGYAPSGSAFSDPYAQAGLDEFDRRRLVDAVVERVVPALAAEAPDLPLAVTLYCGVALSEYDFDARRFDLRSITSCRGPRAPGPRRLSVSTVLSVDRFPTALEAEPAAADAIRGRVGPAARIVAGVEASLAAIEVNDRGDAFRLVFRSERLRLFADESLADELRAYDLTPAEAAPAPTGDVAAIAARYGLPVVRDRVLVASTGSQGGGRGDLSPAPMLRHLLLARYPDLLDDDRRALALSDLLSPETRRQILGGVVDRMSDIERRMAEERGWPLDGGYVFGNHMTEFDRRDILQRLRGGAFDSVIGAAPGLPIPVMIDCHAGFEPYDFDAGRYVFARDPAQACGALALRGGDPLDIHNVEVTAPVPGDFPEGVALPPDQARAFSLRLNAERSYFVQNYGVLGIEARITGIREVPAEGERRRFQVEMETAGAAFYDSYDYDPVLYRFDMRGSTLAEREAAEAEAAAEASSALTGDPDAPTGPVALDDETLLLLLTANAPEAVDEADLRRWARAVGRAEDQENEARPWPVHFTEAAREALRRQGEAALDATTLEAFGAWNARRAAALPETLRLPPRRVEVPPGADAVAVFETPTPDTARSDTREVAEAAGVPLDRVVPLGRLPGTVDVRAGQGQVYLILPRSGADYRIPAPADSAGGRILVSAAVAIAGVTHRGEDRYSVVRLRATPHAGLVVDRGGAVLSKTPYAPGEAEALAAVSFPPIGYWFVENARLGGTPAEETLYTAADLYGSSTDEDEFARRERVRQAIAAGEAYADGETAAEGVWITGRLRMGEFDFAERRFAPTSLSPEIFAPADEGLAPRTASAIRLAFDNPDIFHVAWPDETAARDWQQGNPSHPDYAFRARVVPVAAEAGRTPMSQQLTLHVLEVAILDSGVSRTVVDPRRIRHRAVAEDAAVAGGPEVPGDEPDILEVRLGTPFEAALEALAGEIEAAVRYAASPPARAKAGDRPAWAPYNDGVLLRHAKGAEAVAVFREPPEVADEVTAITRHLVFPDGEGPPLAPLADLLVDKYGDPAGRAEDPRGLSLAWAAFAGLDKAALQRCRSRVADLAGRAGTSLVRDPLPWGGEAGPLAGAAGEAMPLDLAGLTGGMAPVDRGCGPVVVARIEAVEGRATGLRTALVDPWRVQALAEARRSVAAGGSSADGEDGGADAAGGAGGLDLDL